MPDVADQPNPSGDQPVSHGTLVDRLLDGLVNAVKQRKSRDGLVQRSIRAFRTFLLALSAAYLGFLAVILALMEWHGEKHFVLAFLLYLPPTGWLLPLLVLTPVCLLFRWRLIALHAGAVALVVVIYMSPRWSVGGRADRAALTVLTNNRGEANYTSPTEYIREKRPDIIAFQEAGREQAYRDAYPELQVKAVGEFTLLTRFQIKDARALPLTLRNQPVGARFELDCDGRPLVIYNIHFVSPRIDLDQMRGLGFPVLLLAPSTTRFGPVREKLKERWSERLETVRQLDALMRQETLPTLAVGDFNFPDHGRSYHTMAAHWEDAFAEGGRGYGFTMPGATRNPLSFFGPWLRIDYIWSGRGLKPVWCEREPQRASQHRAVVAGLDWEGD